MKHNQQTPQIKKYPAYKDSGEGWLGKIPKSWTLNKLKNVFNEKKIVRNKNLGCGAISFGTVVSKDDGKIPLSTKSSYQEVLKGEFLINPLNLNYDLKSLRIALSNINVVVSSGYIVLINHITINKYYYKWLLHIYDVSYMKLLGSGVRQTINFNHISNSLLVKPPILEQKAIANYLDKKTTLIDKAINQKQKLIERLKERQQIIIQNAVTKGINPKVKLKDSGVGWIGDIPEHWEVKRCKYLFSEIDKRSEKGKEELLSVSHMTGVTPRSERNVYMFMSEDYSGSKVCKKNDLVFNIMWAWMGALGVSQQTGIVSPSYAIFRQFQKNEFNMVFIEYLLKTEIYISFYNKVSTGLHSSRLRFYSRMFFAMELIFPSKEEQDEIIIIINTEIKKTTKAINLQQQTIEKLKEYKATLINSAVTGKIKLC